jgi:hypothetical protein
MSVEKSDRSVSDHARCTGERNDVIAARMHVGIARGSAPQNIASGSNASRFARPLRALSQLGLCNNRNACAAAVHIHNQDLQREFARSRGADNRGFSRCEQIPVGITHGTRGIRRAAHRLIAGNLRVHIGRGIATTVEVVRRLRARFAFNDSAGRASQITNDRARS